MAQIPKQASAAVTQTLNADDAYSVRTVDVPVPGPDQVLVAIEASGVCHSDCAARWPVAGALIPIRPLIGGHEGVGKVVSVGQRVSTVTVGQRVGITFINSTCHNCEMCNNGNENLCPNDATYSGFTTQGTFARYAVANSRSVVPIPDGIESEQACPILCAGLTVWKNLKLAKASAGQWVVIPGAGGGLGHLACQYAAAAGLRVIGIDAPAKRDLVMRCGAEHFIDYTSQPDVPAEVLKITQGGAHIALVATAHESGYTQALQYLRPLGKLAAVGISPIPLHSAQLIGRGLSIVASLAGTVNDCIEALDFVARGKVKCEITVRKLEDLEQTLHDLEAGKIAGRVVLRIADDSA